MSRIIIPITRHQFSTALAIFGIDDLSKIVNVELTAASGAVTVTVQQRIFDEQGQLWESTGRWEVTIIEGDWKP
jgi:hypothetical protein